jgi:hypothetical protein
MVFDPLLDSPSPCREVAVMPGTLAESMRLAEKAVRDHVRLKYKGDRDFQAESPIEFGKGKVYPVRYTNEAGDTSYLRYVFDDGEVSIYRDLYSLAATHGKRARGGLDVELIRICGLIALAIVLIMTLLVQHSNPTVATAIVGLIGVTIGYIAGDRNRPPSTNRAGE